MESWCRAWAERIGPSNDNASETKANESFDIGVFFDIEAKRTPSIVGKFISKRSEHVYIKEFKYRSEVKQVDIM
jgi:hypothetical protein